MADLNIHILLMNNKSKWGFFFLFKKKKEEEEIIHIFFSPAAHEGNRLEVPSWFWNLTLARRIIRR